MQYLLGQSFRFRAIFRNVAGELTDPSTVTFHVRTPAGTTTSYVYLTDVAVVRESLGIYYVVYTPVAVGTHFCDVVGTGAVGTVDEDAFTIIARHIA